MTKVRKGQAPATLSRVTFRERFEASFFDPAFQGEREAITRLEAIAWDGYEQGRKAPRTEKPAPASRIRTTTCRSNGARRVTASSPPKTSSGMPRRRLAF